jgi:hypothetical protein
MTDIIGRLLDEAEKAQRKGHLLLAEVCRDASDQLGLVIEERNRLRDALREIMAHIASARGGLTYTECAVRDITHVALKEAGHE